MGLTENYLAQAQATEPWPDEQVTSIAAQKQSRRSALPQKTNQTTFYSQPLQRIVQNAAQIGSGRSNRPRHYSDGSAEWPGDWYVHSADMPLLETLRNGGWQPRTTLLSPFDNLICDRDRTLMWDFTSH